jgi:hypothetical protein
MSVAAALAQTDPTFIIRQAIDAHGGEDAINKYPASTATLRGATTFGGGHMPFTGTVAQVVPGRYRLETTIDVLGLKTTVVQTVNADKVRQTVDGAEMTLGSPMQKELRQMAMMQEMSMLAPLLDKKRFKLKSEKSIKVDGKTYLAIMAKAEGMKDVMLYFDKTNGLLVGMQRRAIDPKMVEVTEITSFEQYEKVSGVMVPMKQTTTHDGRPYMTLTYSDYKLLEKIDDATFAIP